MPRITKAMVPESPISETRTKDKKKHSYKRLLPMLVITEESPKAFAAGITQYLADNNAIKANEECVIITAGGKELKGVPASATKDDGSTNQEEGKALIPNHDLPFTYGDLVNAINNAVEAKHRQQMGALLTKTFTEPKKKDGGAADDGAVSDDLSL